MKKILVLSALLWVCIFMLPFFTVKETQAQQPLEHSDEPAAPSAQQTASIDSQTKITLCDGGEVKTLPLDEYLCGVVAAEMPALFPEEALKAQAVAARTYAMNKVATVPDESHMGAQLCSNASHCKAYKPLSSFTANWGVSSQIYSEKIKSAVSATDGEILLYDSKPISAVFHSTSSGMTERAADVWGKDVPYLQNVESDESESPKYEDSVELTPDAFVKVFRATYPAAVFPENRSEWIGDIKRSAAGGVMTLKIGGVELKGTAVRTMFGLRSTNFSVDVGEKIVFSTKGYGHGVGMSQYGARAMAKSGADYREILNKYYLSVQLGKISLDES